MANIKVSHLYPKPWAHSAIPHPDTGAAVRLMSAHEVLFTARRLVDFIRSGTAAEVVVIESGAHQLANICRTLCEGEGLNLKWRTIKVSRDADDGYYLPEGVPDNSNFIVLDEYVDSGTTLRRVIKRLESYGKSFAPKVICYTWLNEDRDLAQYYGYSLYRGRRKLYWCDLGAYPFENRIDLNGYFYTTLKVGKGKHFISTFAASVSRAALQSSEEFLAELWPTVAKTGFIDHIKSRANLPAIRNFLDLSHCVRFAIWQFELLLSPQAASCELLYQLWDMYGPMWSPYPVPYHLDFWRAFEGAPRLLREIPHFQNLLHKYLSIREPLIHTIAACCERRRVGWQEEIFNSIRALRKINVRNSRPDIYFVRSFRRTSASSVEPRRIPRRDNNYSDPLKKLNFMK